MNDHTCQVLHRSIDRICDSWPWALEDTDARGYTASGYGVNRTQTEDTPVEAAALTESKAAAWLAELADTLIGFGIKSYRQSIDRIRQRMHRLAGDVVEARDEHLIARTIRLANRAALLWPDPPKPGTTTRAGDQIDESCGLCQLPAPSGHNPDGQLLARRIDGVPFHTIALPGQHAACYWQVWRQRRQPTG